MTAAQRESKQQENVPPGAGAEEGTGGGRDCGAGDKQQRGDCGAGGTVEQEKNNRWRQGWQEGGKRGNATQGVRRARSGTQNARRKLRNARVAVRAFRASTPGKSYTWMPAGESMKRSVDTTNARSPSAQLTDRAALRKKPKQNKSACLSSVDSRVPYGARIDVARVCLMWPGFAGEDVWSSGTLGAE